MEHYSEGLEFVCGRSGSGKSTQLYEQIIRESGEHPERNYILLVPEQVTLLVQQQLIAMHPEHILMNIDILSFNRLAYRLKEELHLVLPAILDDTGKMMILRRALGTCRRELEIFRDSLNQMGFLDELKSLFTELCQYEIEDEMLYSLEQDVRTTPLLKKKLRDLQVISRAFRSEMADRFMMAEELMAVLRDHIADSALVANTSFYLDGYTGFTPLQYEVLRELMRCSRGVHAEMTARPEDLEGPILEHELFALSRTMENRLRKDAEELGIPVTVTMTGDVSYRFSEQMGALAFFEKQYGRIGRGRDVIWDGSCEEIEAVYARTPDDEVKILAARIRSLLKSGMRMKDIAVVSGDPERYESAVRRHFGAMDFSFFIDEKRDMTSHPIISAILAGLEAAGEGYHYESLYHFLKSDLSGLDRELVNRMENYCLAFGIQGRTRWEEPWTILPKGMPPEALVLLNEGRERVLACMDALAALCAKELTVRERLTLLYEFLAQRDTEALIEAMAQELEEGGEYDLAKEYRQSFEKVCGLFDQLVGLMGEDVLSYEEFREILKAGFAGLSIGVVPSTLDRLVVGDLKRTRLGEIRVLFVLGVNEGVIPSSPEKGGILSEMDRRVFAEHSINLAPDSKQEIYTQRYYLYRILTKPHEKLILSYSLTDSEGKACRRSELIDQLCELIPSLTVKAGDTDRLPFSKKEGLERLADAMRGTAAGEEDPLLKPLYSYYSGADGQSALAGKMAARALYTYLPEKLDPREAFRLYGDRAVDSVTRLQRFAACEYAHFLAFGLQLKERKEYALNAADFGSLYHKMLEVFTKLVKSEGLSLEELSEEDRNRLTELSLAEAVKEYGNQIYESSHKNRYLLELLTSSAKRTFWAISRQLKSGRYHVWANEHPFSMDQTLQLPGGDIRRISFRGVVDRIDCGESEDGIYARVVDYKTGAKDFDLTQFANGLQLQLPIYLGTALRDVSSESHSEALPGGFYYYQIRDPFVEAKDSQDEIDEEMLSQLQMVGETSGEPGSIALLDTGKGGAIHGLGLKRDGGFTAHSRVFSEKTLRNICSFAEDQTVALGSAIYEGNMSINPYQFGQENGCTYCSYASVCGFEQGIGGFRFRRLKKVERDELEAELALRYEEASDAQAEASGAQDEADPEAYGLRDHADSITEGGER